MKTCRDCGQSKRLSEFYKHPGMTGGHLSSCKECRRAYAKHHRVDDPSVRERDNERQRTPGRRAQVQRNAQRWRKKYPDRYQAQNAANNAVRDGKLKRKPCQMCGSKKYVHKHHGDYSKPLNVVWLCARCHSRETYPA